MNTWARRRTSQRRQWAGRAATALIAAGFLGLVVGWVLLWTWVFMTCWNFVVPSLFNGPALTFWQAFAFCVVLNIIGGAFRASVQVKR